jgi:hypothetical protein
MKLFTSVLAGAAALTGAALTTLPAQADAGIGVQIGPLGINIGVDQYRDYCRDYSYRHRNYDDCNRYRFDDDYYSDRGEDYRWQQSHHRRDARYGRDDTDFNVSLGDVVFGYSDGYYDNERRWHDWSNDDERNWYQQNHRQSYYQMQREQDRDSMRRDWREGRRNDWRGN